MNEKIRQIRSLLDEIEQETQSELSEQRRIVSGLELPDLVRDIVDFLMPNLTPYQAAYYWYMFRRSVVDTGINLVRISTTVLQEGVISSGRLKGNESGIIAASTVRESLQGLEKAGAIRKESDPDREGTLYRVLLPDEIELCQRTRANLESSVPAASPRESEADYYNVRENRLKVWERDSYKCRYCGKQLTRFTATLDHVIAVANGGDNSFGNLVTACLSCNSKKHSRPVGDYLADENPT
jgi:hypothetical protein